MATLVVIWVLALIALLPGISASSGPTIAASLAVLAAAPVVLLSLLGYSAAAASRRRHGADVRPRGHAPDRAASEVRD
jgi:hypothetical protein